MTWTDALNPVLSLALVLIGLYCLLTRNRIMRQIIGLSIMLQGALLSLVDAGLVNGHLQVTQTLVISALVVEAIVLTIILALVVNVFLYYPEGRVDDLDKLKG